MGYLRVILATGILGFFALSLVRAGPFTWLKRDKFDEIMDRLASVTAQNCRSKPQNELELPSDSVAQVPQYNKLLSRVLFANRSMLLNLHNMALNRAFYYSFIYQRMNLSDQDFPSQPGFEYLYMSAAADVTAFEGFINGSALLFDNNCSYPNWYTTVDFNKTLELFGPRSWRADDYNEPTNWLREPSNLTCEIQDYAAGRDTNYTAESFKYCPYTRYEFDPTDASRQKPLFWWPDNTAYKDSLRKFMYSVGIKFSNQTGKFLKDEYDSITFFGPPQPGQGDTEFTLPVMMTKPYFDCGRSNRWIVSMTAPVVEFMPRYSNWTHLRRPRFVAISGMDAEFERIDINPCPTSDGNEDPNMFAGTARCKPTTLCEPLSGWGFRRGGYQCMCRPGYYYPWWHDGPFQGWEIEQATEEEYRTGFDCLSTQDLRVIPNQNPAWVTRRKRSTELAPAKDRFIDLVSPELVQTPRKRWIAKRSANKITAEKSVDINSTKKKRFVPNYHEETPKLRKKRDAFEEPAWSRMVTILNRRLDVTRKTCKSKEANELYLPGDVSYGVNRQFEAQGRTALRMAHFLSNFLQNVDEYEQFGELKGDRRLNETHIFGEVLSMVMADFKVRGAGVFFDRYKFRMSPPVNSTDARYATGITREFFGPFAFRNETEGGGLDTFRAVDFAGFSTPYVDEPWFRQMKGRWVANFNGLKKYVDKFMLRSGPNITSLIRFEHYPITYRAPRYEDGEWSRPYFRCDDMGMDWVVTYYIPFFGMDSLKSNIEFKGVVTIDVSLKELDIIQCPAEFYVANAFKNTAKCDYKSQYCVPIPGKRFQRGGYKCECRQGYEYPLKDVTWFFDGQTMEEEYEKKQFGLDNKFDTLKCRIAGAASIIANWGLMSVALVLLFFWNK
ncbi:hypothetical protein ACJMK2_027869 [Sinanodonta woodiana]|uniref:GPR158/179 extracellular domain-containing protein n=1 Tax=Sinanodonta woodiana TaxID=1069815 RepID=A0ABD3X742_SINWO